MHPPSAPSASPRHANFASQRIGAGRSGVVFKGECAQGFPIARKVFDSGPLTKLVQYLFLGAPNPYAWNQSSVQCALLRRRILTPMVRHWFGDKLRVASAKSFDWNSQFRAFQLDTEFVRGGSPLLHHPMNRRGSREVEDLVHYVMAPLQGLLRESGFDGLVWQAGLGNPVALANFLKVEGTDRFSRWAWIDLESGVPALFPCNPMELLRFYLPASWKYRRPLFDDVDTNRLTSYLSENEAALISSVGEEALEAIRRDVAELEFHQHEWKSQPRAARGIRYQEAKGRLSAEHARYFLAHPWQWYLREASRVPPAVIALTIKASRKLGDWVAHIPWIKLALATVQLLISSKYRWSVAQKFVAKRIDSWERRKQLLPGEANRLRSQLGQEESCAYLTDFAVHIAIKPFVKVLEYFVFGALLYGSGVIDEGTFALVVLLGGCLARTLYTLMRMCQAAVRGHELPWVALITGVFPVIGNLAYPLQIVYSSTEEDDVLAQFILYDGCSTIGRRMPIWGGYDTLTEHAFNHLPDRVVTRT
ncbi:MAG: hypothetical protein ACI841_000344 [Planctomycetota bacterium]|jgi:hypothetical protein